MNGLLRIAVLVSITLAIGWKVAVRAPDVTIDAPEKALEAVLGDRQLGPINRAPGAQGRMVWQVRVKGCARPLLVAPTAPSFSGAAELIKFAPEGNRRLFAYFDWLSPTPDRGAILLRRSGERLLRIAGLSPYTLASTRLLFISEPSECNVAANLPWRRFWLRSRKAS